MSGSNKIQRARAMFGEAAARHRSGDLAASGPPEAVVPHLPTGGSHWTRDLAFSPDGKTLFVSVGSATNVAEGVAAGEGVDRRRRGASCSPLGDARGRVAPLRGGGVVGEGLV